MPFGPTIAIRSPRSMCRLGPTEDDVVAVGLVDVLQFEDHPAALHRGREREVDALALGRDLDRDDLLEHLDPALHLRGLGRLVAEPVDEHLHPRQLFVLLALRLAHAFELRLALGEVVAVVARVVVQRPQVHLGDPRDDRVEEVAVVRHEDDRERVVVEVLLQPVAGLEVEVVGRLVEQQQVRPAEQQLGQRDAHLPAAGERLAGALRGRPGRSRDRRAPSRSSGRCCSRRAGGSGPAGRCSATSICSCSPSGTSGWPSRSSSSCISALTAISGSKASSASS